MKKIAVVCFLLIVSAAAFQARAQVAPAANHNRFHVDVGGFGSAFQPNYAGGGVTGSSNWLFGAGAFADVSLSRWVQIEAEARWLRFNQFVNIHQDNYLIGPRVPIHTFGKFTPYGKFLFGIGHMNFEFNATSCRCSDLVYGGGVDYKLSNRWNVRAVDFEYQQWPSWYVNQNAQLHPYGFSSGISYRLF
ncbi:MAG TPA: outer membrane beta-barrel protein [Terracidiphilus sp.]|nr:outer membrane beta-barrel protein [Terracidiphilus sp.]